MSISITTSDGARDKDGHLNWIVDVDAPDVDDFIYDASSDSVLCALEAAGLYDFSRDTDEQRDTPIAVAAPAVHKALEAVDPDDDFLIPRLNHVERILLNGKARGATYLTFA